MHHGETSDALVMEAIWEWLNNLQKKLGEMLTALIQNQFQHIAC